MNRRLNPRVALLAVSVFAGCGGCETQTQDAVPIFSVAPSTLDFGVLCLNESLEQTISLRNSGTGDLVIQSSTLSGEGYELVEPLPDSIAPGDETAIRVRLTVTSGTQTNGSLKIETDDPETPNRTVTFVGEGFDGERLNVKASCELRAGTGFQEGCAALNYSDGDNRGVPAGTTRDRTVRIENAGCALATVNAVYFVPGDDQTLPAELRYFSVVSEPPPFELPGGTSKDIVVRFSPPAGAAVDPYVRLKIETNVPPPARGSWEYGLFASSISPQLLVSPEILTFFEAQAGTPLRKDFTVQNTGTDVLHIDRVELVPENGTTEFTLELPNNATGFDISPSSTVTGRAVYTSTGPGGDRAKVVVRAGSLAPEIRLLGGTEPSLVVRWLDENDAERLPAVDFGTTTIPADCVVPQVRRTVRLRNDGRAPLTISGIAIPASDNPGGGYKLSGAMPTSIADGQYADIVVTFDDFIRLINDSARLRITSNDPVDAAFNGVRTVDLVSTNTGNFPPIARIDPSAGPAVRRTLTLSGANSTSEAGDVLTYAWRVVEKNPSSSTIRFENAAAVETRVISDAGPFPDFAGDYRFELKVTDQCGQTSIPSTVLVQVQP
jgi:hypothetical protein